MKLSAALILLVSVLVIGPACSDYGARPASSSNDGAPSGEGRRQRSPGRAAAEADLKAAQQMINAALGSPDERLQAKIAEHGADRLWHVHVTGAPPHTQQFIADALRDQTGMVGLRKNVDGGSFVLTFIPLLHVESLMEKIDFALSVDLDPEAHVLAIEADPSKLPPPPDSAYALPDGPGFYRANLVELTCGVDHRCRAALPRLTKAEPKELREEIARAIENLLIADDKETRRRAVEALSVWSTSDLVPLLIDLLDDESGDVRAAAIEALAEREDPRAHGPVAQCLGRSTEEGRAAAEYLKRMGAKAEQALLPCLEHEDIRARLKALELLAEFGTPETKLAAAIAALDDSESIVRSRACSILEELKDARAVEPLVELFFDHSVHASDCLIAHGPAAEEAVLKLLSDWRRDVVMGAVKILEKIGTEKSIPALMVLSRSNDISLRGAVNAAGKAIVAREGIEIPPGGVPR